MHIPDNADSFFRIGSQVKKILDNFVFAKGKKIERPLIIMVITDGEVRHHQSISMCQ